MKIIDLYRSSKKPVFSIEVLPPRNGTDEKVIFDVIHEVTPYNIGFVSITMGSDLSLRGGSLALAALIKSRFNIEVLPHCTCVRRSKEEIENLLTEYRYLDLDNILALRGDPPQGEDKFTPSPLGHSYATEMIDQIVQMNKGKYLIRNTDKEFDSSAGKGFYKSGIKTHFCIGAAGHPDGHPECASFEENFIHLKEKQEAGAEFVITQAFFSIDIFKKFLEKADNHNIKIPIIPGIMPVLNKRNLLMVQDLFKVSVPQKLLNLFEKNLNNPEELKKIGVDYARTLCHQLIELNVEGIQLFTLNRKGLAPEILSGLK